MVRQTLILLASIAFGMAAHAANKQKNLDLSGKFAGAGFRVVEAGKKQISKNACRDPAGILGVPPPGPL